MPNRHFLLYCVLAAILAGVVGHNYSVQAEQALHSRVEGWTWDNVEQVLRLQISRGVMRDGRYRPRMLEHDYELRFDCDGNPKKPEMWFEGYGQQIPVAEADGLCLVFSKLEGYAMDSVEWFRHGTGEPVEKRDRAARR